MSTYVIDNTEEIARRLKELEAEKDLARSGSSAPVTGQEPKEDVPSVETVYGWGMYGTSGVPMSLNDIWGMYERG